MPTDDGLRIERLARMAEADNWLHHAPSRRRKAQLQRQWQRRACLGFALGVVLALLAWKTLVDATTAGLLR